MLRSKQMGRLSAAIVALGLAGTAIGCQGITNQEITDQGMTRTSGHCMAVIDWADILMINDITYVANDSGSGNIATDQLGDQVGEVTYMLNDHACANHVLQNGDAAFLPAGTAVYALKGYKPEFRVAAGNKMYQVSRNPHAATMGDLFDIAGNVDKVGLDSGIDGSPIGDFSAEASVIFTEELLPLAYVGFDEVYQAIKHEAGVFLRVYLTDRTSFRMVYYPEANAFSSGAFGTEALKELIMSERARIKAAAGL